MIVRSFTGRTVPEALAKVRDQLGAKALIIETRSVKEPGMFGRRCGYEVVAACDDDQETDRNDDAPLGRKASWQELMLAEQRERQTAQPATAPVPAQVDQLSGLRAAARDLAGTGGGYGDELSAIRRQLARLASGHGTPTTHLGEELASRLEDAELPGELIAELDEAVAQAGERLSAARRGDFCTRLLARSLACPGAIDWEQSRQLMLVGPTGVGKTTTIAKLAGELVLRQQRRVALVTIDTYRVGAADQLQTYADLLGIPCAVARTPSEAGDLLASYAHYDNVLIDTAGRRPSDATRLHELRAFCRAAPGMRVMLAVAATCGRAEFASVVERFSTLPVEHAVLTKLDESAAPGRVIGCLRRHRLPLNYVTTGQEVPTDMIPAEAGTLAASLLTAAQVDTTAA